MDQHESIRLWLKELSEEKGYTSYMSDEFSTNYTFTFMSTRQKNILLQSPYWCLDATHKTTNVNNCLLYNVIVRHPATGTGCPVAYCYTTSHAVGPITELLTFFEEQRAVFPEAQIQWCLFHVARAWSSKVREPSRTGSSATNSVLHRAVISALKGMMWERNTTEFNRRLVEFLASFGEHTELISYLRTNYFISDSSMRWACCYQPDVYTNMETNNYDVEEDYQQNVCRLMLNVGRMGPEERRIRRRQIEAEQFATDVLPDMISESNTSGISAVQSFTDQSIYYEVEVSEDEMISCECKDFSYNKRAGKHMYLLNRLHVNISPYKVNFQEVSYDIVQVEEENTEVVEGVAAEVEDNNIAGRIQNLKAVFRSYEEHISLVNDEKLSLT
ncbi:hypothetical protein BDB01DRAFT_852855 [Pilobolus umbonatus]|nr:hypothetical protein BDB01DRAFT_852855 [Pilobolus umbonatus]